MSISASLIVKNEESCLRECLESIKGVDEIIIVDTGSEDNTIEIAKEYTDKVYYGDEYKWRDDFAFSRNQALDKCTSDWVLIIDADETLEPDGIDHIRQLVQSIEQDAVYFKTVGKSDHSNVHKSIRLFKRNSGIRWKGKIHNYLSSAIAHESDIKIYYGYSEAHRKDPDRALRILGQVVIERPDCVREKYYLAREYWYRKDYVTAIHWWEQYLKVGHWGPEIAETYMMLARCYVALKDIDEARLMCLKAININANFKEPFELMAKLTGPKNSKTWSTLKELCTNEDVLFNRFVNNERVDVVMLSNTNSDNIKKMTQRAIDSLHMSSNSYKFNIYLIETQSGDIEYNNANVIQPNIPFNYNKFLNIGFKNCTSDYIVISNNDVFFHPNWFEEIVKVNSDSASPYCPNWVPHINIRYKNVSGYRVSREVCGWCIVMKKIVLEKIGDFDEQFDMFYQDDDYSTQLQKNGLKHTLVGNSVVEHYVARSHGGYLHEDTKEKMRLAQIKFKDKYK